MTPVENSLEEASEDVTGFPLTFTAAAILLSLQGGTAQTSITIRPVTFAAGYGNLNSGNYADAIQLTSDGG